MGGFATTTRLEGGCACQSVRYEIILPEPQVSLYHCVQCQARTGSAFSISLLVPRAALAVRPPSTTGPILKTYEQSHGCSGHACVQHLCGVCGVTVFTRSGAPGMQALRFVAAGTLDDKQWLRTRRPIVELNGLEGLDWLEQIVRAI